MLLFSTAVLGAEYRRDAKCKAHYGEHGHVEKVVHKRGCGKRIGVVMPHHGGIGKHQNNNPDLPHKYGQAEMYDSFVVLSH